MKRSDNGKIYNKVEPVLVAAVVGLMAFGVLMVYSASSYNARVNYGNEYYYMFKQLIGVVLGLVAMTACAITDYHILKKWRFVILAVSFAMLVAVFIPGVGVENYGAKRWINLPFFTIQASEIAKFGFIIFTAAYMAKYYEKMSTFRGLIPVLAVGVAMCVLIIAEPNMSITMCMIMLTFAMLFVGGAKMKHFLVLIVPVALLVPVLIMLEPYRLKRLTAFLDPWSSPLGEGYQLIQSFYALGSGGLFGLGLFNSRQKYLFLPFSESDFIFSVIGEELGLVGCVASGKNREERQRPFRLLSVRGHSRDHSDTNGGEYRGRDRIDTADRASVTLRQRRNQFPRCLLRRYRYASQRGTF